jgi:hypothetical protein
MELDSAAYLAAYPMAPFGGLFIAIVGLGIVLGAPIIRFRNYLLIAGFVAASAGLTFGGRFLSPQAAAPTRLQVAWLIFAIVVEIVLIGLAVARWRGKGERKLQLVILAIVGGHFLLMIPAFGSVMLRLGLATMANAGLALAVPAMPLWLTWLIDGGLKILFGGLMVLLVFLLGSPLH